MQRELISLRILIEEYIIEDCWYNAPAERSLHVTYRFESCILQMKEESYQGYSTWFKAKIYTLTHITWLRVYHFPLPNNSTAENYLFPLRPESTSSSNCTSINLPNILFDFNFQYESISRKKAIKRSKPSWF